MYMIDLFRVKPLISRPATVCSFSLEYLVQQKYLNTQKVSVLALFS